MRAVAAAFLLAWAAQSAGADVSASVTAAGSAPAIVLPKDGDDYSKLVARAAAQDKDVDFRALRFAYLKSAARKHAADERELREALFAAAKTGDDKAVRDAAIALISAHYVDMWGHKYLRQACTKLHDDACAAQARFVEFGLLKSIVSSGDGKTCPTGWEVVSVDEEYFVLGMIGALMHSQSLIGGPPACDLLETTDEEGKAASYYFRIDAVLEDESAMLGLH